MATTDSQDDDVRSIDYPPSEKSLPIVNIYSPNSPHVLALLIPASLLGVLARLGLQALATYDGQSIFPLAYIQATGCLIMGFFLHIKEPIGEFYGPLYTALTTGFCGSLTTFSGWQFDIFSSWINASHYHRAGLRDFIDGTGKSIFTLSLSLASLSFGSYLASLALPYVSPARPPGRLLRNVLTAFAILTYAAAFPAYFHLPAKYRHQATAALLFAYPGTLTRYILAIQLNHIKKSFPIGTFTANIFGTGLLCAFHVLQNISAHPLSQNSCAILQGLEDGYCGCLTTVSTFAVEISLLKGWKQVRYVAASWVASQLLILAILGPSLLRGSVEKQITCRFD